MSDNEKITTEPLFQPDTPDATEGVDKKLPELPTEGLVFDDPAQADRDLEVGTSNAFEAGIAKGEIKPTEEDITIPNPEPSVAEATGHIIVKALDDMSEVIGSSNDTAEIPAPDDSKQPQELVMSPEAERMYDTGQMSRHAALRKSGYSEAEIAEDNAR